MAKKIFIGVGHGGADSGACANGFKEKDLNLSIALACKDELERHGVEVRMSRTKDESDPLKDEIKECNAYNPDLALDVHNNAGGGKGAEVYHYSKGGASKTLAQNVLDAVVAIGQNSRGLKIKMGAGGKDYFGFIRDIKAPSIIVECAFVDNATDVQIISTQARQQAMGVAIARGVLKTLGITYSQPKAVPAAAATKEIGTCGSPFYLVRVFGKPVNIRSGPGTDNKVVGKITDRGVYTIIATANGTGASLWGRLKSGAGWISMDLCRKL